MQNESLNECFWWTVYNNSFLSYIVVISHIIYLGSFRHTEELNHRNSECLVVRPSVCVFSCVTVSISLYIPVFVCVIMRSCGVSDLDALLCVCFALWARAVPAFGTSRYQARYSSRTLRLASFRSRLKIGFTTLAAAAPVRVAALDAIMRLCFFSAHARQRFKSPRRHLPARSGTVHAHIWSSDKWRYTNQSILIFSFCDVLLLSSFYELLGWCDSPSTNMS